MIGTISFQFCILDFIINSNNVTSNTENVTVVNNVLLNGTNYSKVSVPLNFTEHKINLTVNGSIKLITSVDNTKCVFTTDLSNASICKSSKRCNRNTDKIISDINKAAKKLIDADADFINSTKAKHEKRINDSKLNITLPDINSTVANATNQTIHIVETLYCALCSAPITNIIINFGKGKKAKREDFLRYILASNINQVLAPLDISSDLLDNIIEMLTSDVKTGDIQKHVKELFKSQFDIRFENVGKKATYSEASNNNEQILVDDTIGLDVLAVSTQLTSAGGLDGTTTATDNTGMIIGIVVGAAVLIAIVITAIVCINKKKGRRGANVSARKMV